MNGTLVVDSPFQSKMVPKNMQSTDYYPTRACVSKGLYVIWAGVHLYVCIYVCDLQKSMNGTLVVDSPFQSLAVDFSSNL